MNLMYQAAFVRFRVRLTVYRTVTKPENNFKLKGQRRETNIVRM